MIDFPHRQRRELLADDPTIAFEQPTRRVWPLRPRTVRAYIQWWQWFQKWCRARHLIALPATSEIVLQFAQSCVTEGHPARAREQGVCVSVSTMDLPMAAISHVHFVGNYPDPCTNARSYLKKVPRPNRTLPVAGYTDVQRILTQPARTRVQIRTRCILALLYAVHLRASELVSLRIEDYRPGTRNRLPALRVRSAAPNHDDTWQPLTRAMGKIIDAWIEAGQVTQGPLICNVGRTWAQGRAITARQVVRLLQEVGRGHSAVGVRALHRGLIRDSATRSTRNELTGAYPGWEPQVRARGKGAKYVDRDPRPALRAFRKKQGRL